MEQARFPHKEIAPGYTITVPERGYQDIELTLWHQLLLYPGFRNLLARQLVAEHMGRSAMRLRGTCWVGQASFGDILLQLVEKVDGALCHLLRYATQDAFKVEPLSAPATDLGHLAVLLIQQFLAAVQRYISGGLGFVYTTKRSVASLAGGRLDIPRTLLLHAEGQRHLLAVEKRMLVRDTPTNQIVLAALREVEHLAPVLPLEIRDLVRTRRLAMLFDAPRQAEVLFAERGTLARQAQQLAASAPTQTIRDLLALSSVVLAHQSFEPIALVSGLLPRTWFLNLETLFESAVRLVLSQIGNSWLAVQRGLDVSQRPQLFALTHHQLNPDLVLGMGSAVVAVGDVKYKLWSASRNRDDENQLLVYMGTYRAPCGFLVYPNEQFAVQHYGATSAVPWPNEVYLFGVRIHALENDLRRLLDIIGLAREANPPHLCS